MVNSESFIPLEQLTPWQDPQVELLPPGLVPWLLESGSLTRRLREQLADFSLTLLGYRSLALDGEASQLLGEGCGQCREVILHGGGAPCVYGWTLLPARAMATAQLSGQGETPLGELIFAHPQAQRSRLQLARFRVAANPWSPAAELWGRRSLLFLQGVPLLVHELFLPGLFDAKERA